MAYFQWRPFLDAILARKYHGNLLLRMLSISREAELKEQGTKECKVQGSTPVFCVFFSVTVISMSGSIFYCPNVGTLYSDVP